MGRHDVVAVLQSTPSLVSDILTIDARMGENTQGPWMEKSAKGEERTITASAESSTTHSQPNPKKEKKVSKPLPFYLVVMQGKPYHIGIKRALVVTTGEAPLRDTVEANITKVPTAKTVVLIVGEGTTSANITDCQAAVGDRLLLVVLPTQSSMVVPEGVKVIHHDGENPKHLRAEISRLVASAVASGKANEARQ